MNCRKAVITGINRARIGTDGDGVTTLVCFYGCPLNCRYCLNKHTKSKILGMVYKGYYKYSPQELFNIVKVDDLYFQYTNGGITFGGGEPLLNTDYINEFMRLVESYNSSAVINPWVINIETCFNVPFDSIFPILNYSNLGKIYIDIKSVDPDVYAKYTRYKNGNTQVINNLVNLLELKPKEWINKHIFVKLPNIEGYSNINKSDIDFIVNMGIPLENIILFDYIIQ